MSNPEAPPRQNNALVAAVILLLLMFAANLMVDASSEGWWRAAALGVLLVGLIFVTLPFAHLPRYGRPRKGDPYFAATRLVIEGIYQVVRHPQYLGYALLALGLALLNPHALMIVLAAGSFACFYMQAIHDDSHNHAHFGELYDQYAASVPRFNFVLGLLRWASRAS